MAVHLDHGYIPSCSDCRAWVYTPDWQPVKVGGKPFKRPAGTPLPCWNCPKAEDGRPNPGADMQGRNWLTFQVWLQSRAGLPVPDDPLLRSNLALIQFIMEERQAREGGLAASILAGLIR